MIPTLARTSLVGYRGVVAGLIGVGVLSFAVWAHHMFTAGLRHGGDDAGLDREPGDRRADRAAGLRLARDPGPRPARHQRRQPLPPRLLLHLRARRPDRRDGRGAAVRRAGARHLLRRRPPALRADRRPGLPDVRGALPLDAAAQGPAPLGAGRPLGLRPDVRRLQPGLLSDAHRRPAGHAAARLHLPGRPRLGPLEPAVDARRGGARRGNRAVLRRCAARLARRGPAARRPVAGRHARMAAAPRTTACAAFRKSIRASRCGAGPACRARWSPARTGCRAPSSAAARRSSPIRAGRGRCTCSSSPATAGGRSPPASARPASSCC